MAAVTSTMQALTTPAPEFYLPDTRSEQLFRLSEQKNKPLF